MLGERLAACVCEKKCRPRRQYYKKTHITRRQQHTQKNGTISYDIIIMNTSFLLHTTYTTS
jgi:hypothetical protein